MYLVIFVCVYMIFAYFFVDWKHWKEFYPTIQFYIICNLLYNFIFFNHTLWAYKPKSSWLNHTFIDLTFSFIIIPIVIMVYLRYIPKTMKNKIVYLSAWVTLFTIIEFIFQNKGMLTYSNGWNLFNSAYFNIIMFIVLGTHYKRPLLAILLSIPTVAVLLYFHHPSFLDLK
jgi:hypothetical protein